VKLPDVYRDWRIVAGLMLALVGAVNWFVGLNRTRVASAMIAQAHRSPTTDYRSFDEVDSTAGVLKPFAEEEARVSYATARMDFYHATFLTGQVLVIVGLIVTLIGFINVIQRDTRRSMRRLAEEVPFHIRERHG